MLNSYRATPLVVPKPGEAVDRAALPSSTRLSSGCACRISSIPVMNDRALLP